MNTKAFTAGAVAGMSSLLLAVPLLVQGVGAQSASSASANAKPVPTQACVQAMAAMEDAHLSVFDSITAKNKAELQARRDKLKQIGAIADDTARQEAIKKMHEEMKSAMQAQKETQENNGEPAALVSAREAVATACGKGMFNMKLKGGPGHMMGAGAKHGVFFKGQCQGGGMKKMFKLRNK